LATAIEKDLSAIGIHSLYPEKSFCNCRSQSTLHSPLQVFQAEVDIGHQDKFSKQDN